MPSITGAQAPFPYEVESSHIKGPRFSRGRCIPVTAVSSWGLGGVILRKGQMPGGAPIPH